MPWLPDFTNAVELARRQTRAAGQADPVSQYVKALNSGRSSDLETVWPAEVVVYDPQAGEVRGHKHLRKFVKDSKSLLAKRHARTETVASTVASGRAVVELLVHLAGVGGEVGWPVAIVAESPDDRSVIFRSYLSHVSVRGQHEVRSPILEPGGVHPVDVVGRYHAALEAGDTEAIVSTFAANGYFREPVGPPFTHRGAPELRSFFKACFSAGGGIALQHCAVTDDGVRCALEYNCVRWGSHDLAPLCIASGSGSNENPECPPGWRSARGDSNAGFDQPLPEIEERLGSPSGTTGSIQTSTTLRGSRLFYGWLRQRARRYPVSRMVNSAANDGPELILPLAEAV